ncbi:MAG: hypothetical protein JNK87_30740 [Bryobacterales bacterium]|nr:hypothetical protein [Bryobacterales bacterium]
MAQPDIEDILEGRFTPRQSWIDPSLLPSISIRGRVLTPVEIQNLASALIGQPGIYQQSLPVVRMHLDAACLDALVAALIRTCKGEVTSYPLYAALLVASLAGGPETAAALREFLLNPGPMWTGIGVKSFVTLEGPSGIAAAVAASRRLDTYSRNEIDKQIDELCVKHNIGPLERELRSLSSDATSRKPAIDVLKRLCEGGFAWTHQALKETIFANPLLQELAATLVWGELTPTGHVSRTFLLTPDAAPQFPIVIVHPSQITPEEAQSWKSTTKPVFPQFDKRPVNSTAIHLPTNAISPSALLTGLESKGWQRTRPEANVLRQHAKAFPLLHCKAYLRYTGIPIHYGGTWTAQQAISVHFDPPVNSPIAIAEINADLAAIFPA